MGTKRTLRVAVAILAAMIVAIGVTGATATPSTSSRTSTSTSADAQLHAAQTAKNKYGIPALTVYPPNEFPPNDVKAGYVGKIGSATAYASRSKVAVSVGGAKVFGYFRVCTAAPDVPPDIQGIQSCCPDPFNTKSCPKDLLVKFPALSDDNLGASYWAQTTGPLWVKSPKGVGFGTFPRTTVRLLAFGSVPATATIEITQPLDSSGFVRPLAFSQIATLGYPTPGATVRGFPVANPGTGNDSPYKFNQETVTSGPVNVRIVDLRVDGVPMNIGAHCETAEPGTLSGADPRGWYDASVSPTTLIGRPGGFQPLSTGNGIADTGQLEANLNIGAFKGCRDGRGSLDPLVTALASGPTNNVIIKLSDAVFDCGNPSRTVDCPDYPTVAGKGTPIGARRAAAASSPDLWEHLSAEQRSGLIRAISRLPKARRADLLRTLPAALATPVARALKR